MKNTTPMFPEFHLQTKIGGQVLNKNRGSGLEITVSDETSEKKLQNPSFSRRYTQMFADKIKTMKNREPFWIVSMPYASISVHLRLNFVFCRFVKNSDRSFKTFRIGHRPTQTKADKIETFFSHKVTPLNPPYKIGGKVSVASRGVLSPLKSQIKSESFLSQSLRRSQRRAKV